MKDYSKEKEDRDELAIMIPMLFLVAMFIFIISTRM
jgi:hypothetical protein